MLGHIRRAFARARKSADRGASAVEYGLLVAAIAAVIVGTVFALGGFVKDTFDNTCAAIGSSATPTCVQPTDTSTT